MKKAVLYARVSSKEQEREGFSIPAQLKLLRDYAKSKSFAIVAEFTDVETAGKSGRENFTAMMDTLRKMSERIILVEKTDRLYRNVKDWVILEDLDPEIHFVKEGGILSKDSRSHDKFIHGIKVLMAKNFLDNLREETEKGMREKAEQGVFPTTAPVGYRNVCLPDGKRVIVPDPDRALEVLQLFEHYATSQFTLKSLPRPTWAYPQRLKKLFDNPIYYGEFRWKGKIYQGNHEPIVTRDLWDRCQAVLKGHSRRTRTPNKSFPFSGLITCGWCGGVLIGRLHKGRYIYYHCRNPLNVCPEPYVRQEALEEQYLNGVQRLRFTSEVADQIRIALKESASHTEAHQKQAIVNLRREYDRIQKRLQAAYIDKLDDRIDSDMFTSLSGEWRARQDKITAELAQIETAERIYIDESIALLDLCQRAPALFEVQSAAEKRRLIDVICLNSTFKSQVLEITWRKPFDLLESAAKIEKASLKGQRLNLLVISLIHPDTDTIDTYDLLARRAA